MDSATEGEFCNAIFDATDVDLFHCSEVSVSGETIVWLRRPWEEQLGGFRKHVHAHA